MNFINKLMNIEFKDLKLNKNKKFKLSIKSERRFLITTDKSYGLCFYLEGQMSSDFRRRLHDFNHKDTWLVVYKEKSNQLKIDGIITKNIEEINKIESKYEIVRKIPISSIFYIDIYFSDKELALLFESLFIELYINYVNDCYKEYKEKVIKEKEDWLKPNN